MGLPAEMRALVNGDALSIRYSLPQHGFLLEAGPGVSQREFPPGPK